MLIDRLFASAICTFARVLTGVRARWFAAPDPDKLRVYYPNHRSHGDFVLVWSMLPRAMRKRTRSVAGADYWLKGALRRYVINRVFRGVLVDRQAGRSADPIGVMGQVLAGGESLILFPEGTRNLDDGLLPFKSGLYHLACAHPEVELVPVWIENLGRAMPKGHLVPLPLLCTLSFGEPLMLQAGESKEQFLARTRQALLELAPIAE